MHIQHTALAMSIHEHLIFMIISLPFYAAHDIMVDNEAIACILFIVLYVTLPYL